MKLTIGIPDYPFTCLHEIAGAKIRGRKAGKDIHLILIPHDAMIEQHKKLKNIRGMPARVSFDFKKQRVWLHPNPDGEYELDIDRGEEPPKKDGIVGTITKAVLKGHGA
jgi:hypothetical protein